MKVETDWPEPTYNTEQNAVEVRRWDGFIVHMYQGDWQGECSTFPTPIKERAERIWEENQKLESLTDEELVRRYQSKVDCSTLGWKKALLETITADRKREAEIRERENKAPEWQPIETAPKDRTRILAYAGGPVYLERYAHHEENDYSPRWISSLVTHWMPLPKPPSDI